MFCPWIGDDCVGERCALWVRAKNETYSRCGIAEVVSWAKSQNIKESMRDRDDREDRSGKYGSR